VGDHVGIPGVVLNITFCARAFFLAFSPTF
jgi:hypothetical protein